MKNLQKLLCLLAVTPVLTGCAEERVTPQYVYIPEAVNNFYEARCDAERDVELTISEEVLEAPEDEVTEPTIPEPEEPITSTETPTTSTETPTGTITYEYIYPYFYVDSIDYSKNGLITIYYWTVDYRCDYKLNATDDYTPRIIGDLNYISISEFRISKDSVYVFTGKDPLTQTDLEARNFIDNYSTQEEAEAFDKSHNTIHWEYKF